MSEMPSHFLAVCPNCLVSLRVRVAYSGSHVRCKHCEHKFRAFAPDHPVTPSSEEYQAGPLNTPGSVAERIDVLCPNCSASLSVRSELAGQHVRCNQCDHKFLVKKIEEVPAQIGHADSESNLFDRLDGQPEGPRSALVEPCTSDQRPELAGELAAIREENERLSARLNTLQDDLAAIQSERDSLRVQLEQFRGDHDRLRSEHEKDRQEHQRLLAELAEQLRQRDNEIAAKVEELEGLATLRQADAAESENLRGTLARREQELQQESEGLRGQIDELRRSLAGADQARGDERTRLDEQLRLAREDLDSARSEIGTLQSRLSELVDRHDQLKVDQLEAIEAQRAELGAEFQAQIEDQQTRHVEQIAGLHSRAAADARQENEGLRGQIDQLHRTLASAEQAHGDEKRRLDEQLQLARQELDSARSEIGTLQSRLSELVDRHDQLKVDHLEAIEAQRAELGAEFQAQIEDQRARHAEQITELHARAEADARQASEGLRGQIDELQRTLASAEQTHGDEIGRLDEQRHLAREELDSTRSEMGALQSRLSELLDRHDQLKADHLEAIEAQRGELGAEFRAEIEAQESRHAEQLAELHARAEANDQLVERLKAEILMIAQSRSAPDADLAAAREEIADLRAKLADTEISKRSMSSLLEGMGIRLH